MINIGKVINKKVGQYVGGRCYPLVAEMTTRRPFVCYNRITGYPHTTKDRMVYDFEHNVQINIVTDNYDEGIDILEKICNEFDDYEGQVAGIEVVESKIDDIADFFIDDAYVQQININILTK